MSVSELVAMVIGVALTVMVFSYIFGDRLFFGIATHILIGVGSGFLVLLIIQKVIVPYLISPLSEPAEPAFFLALVPLVFSILLILMRIIQGFALGDGARHTVKDKAIHAVRLCQALFHDSDDDIIGNQSTGVHKAFCLLPHRGAVFHGGTQNITGRNGRDCQFIAEDFCLGALTGARGAQQHDVHGEAILSRYADNASPS